MDVDVEVPYRLTDLTVTYQPAPESGYAQVGALCVEWLHEQGPPQYTLTIRGRGADLSAFASRIRELVDHAPPHVAEMERLRELAWTALSRWESGEEFARAQGDGDPATLAALRREWQALYDAIGAAPRG